MTTLILPVAGKSSRFKGLRPKWLLTMPDGKLLIEKSIRNIPNIKVTDINHFSAFDIVKFKKVVFTESSVKELEKRYA